MGPYFEMDGVFKYEDAAGEGEVISDTHNLSRMMLQRLLYGVFFEPAHESF